MCGLSIGRPPVNPDILAADHDALGLFRPFAHQNISQQIVPTKILN
jgi:hypothetical protein